MYTTDGPANTPNYLCFSWPYAADAETAALLTTCLDAALDEPESNVYLLQLHRSLPGEHVDDPDCWCSPSFLVFGANCFVAEA